VLRAANSRGGSVAMHELEAAQTIQISDPKNHFPLSHGAHHNILFAGGIGITPILCMAERLASIDVSFELHFCTRSVERTAFIDRIRSSSFANRVHFHFDDGAAEQKLDVGRLTANPRPGVHLYVCGPTGFMDSVLETARCADWPEERLHREYFTSAPIDTSNDGSFEVQIASTGEVIHVGAEQTVIAALAARGVDIPTSCEQGVCGTCLTGVIQGTPEHRDMFLTPDEQANGDQFLPCCSRAKSPRLVLDL
jgi:vanillate monooxygenase ferredoxin subunit